MLPFPQPGSSLNGFIFDEEIDSGSSNSVWRAHTVDLPNVNVAIKCTSKEAVAAQGTRTRLTREIVLLAKMRHPFIAEFFRFMEDRSNFYIVLEFAGNGDLRKYMGSRLAEELARRYFMQLVWVLEYLHFELHVAHRNIKPENVLLDMFDNIRLIDFGLSCGFSDANPELKTACGSPAYAAPEVINGRGYTRSADIWSTGVLLYSMVAGVLPFDGETVGQLFREVTETEPIYPKFLSPPLVDLLQKMLCKDPEERIDIEMIKRHPWFSNSKYTAMVESSTDLIRQWLAHERGSAWSSIDTVLIATMSQHGIDCRGLPESLLLGDETEIVILYRILCRQNLTDGMNLIMQQINQHTMPSAKPPVLRQIATGRQSGERRSSLTAGGSTARSPSPAGKASPQMYPITPPRPRRLSRPVPVHRPETFRPNTSHETL
jgi:serine/threonine protein kinase